MRLPKLFVPENKDIDKKLENLLQENKTVKKARIGSIDSLTDIPEVIGEYVQRTQPENIQKKDWDKYFGDNISKYLTEVIEMIYTEPCSSFFTCIRILEFKSKTLDEANKVIDLKARLDYNWQTMEIVSLKKGNYLVTIRKNQLDEGNGLEVIGNYYRENFGLEGL